jgi:hypothetical protein
MAVKTSPHHLQPANPDVVIWRFMSINKFRDLITTSKLYFQRSDLFPQDENEGLPPENYLCAVFGLDRLFLPDRRRLDHELGTLAEFREGFYVSCWHLFRSETDRMWNEYGNDGVAICSRYSLLKSALDAMPDEAFLGLVWYGDKHLNGEYNLLRFIMTKREKYKDDQEVRAMLWIRDPHATINRHWDAENRPHRIPPPPPDRVLSGHKRRVDLQTLITEIVVTPWASPAVFNEVHRLVTNNGYSIPVQPSGLTRYRQFLLSTPRP